MNRKYEKLKELLLKRGSITVALSGGVDSVFLLVFSKEILGDKVKAVTAIAPNFAPDETSYAKELCKKLGIDHETVTVNTMEVLFANEKDRCYHCKKAIFEQLIKQGENIADGTNLDDMSDYRPGIKALQELGIWSPLKEAGLTKEEIREGLKERGIDIWQKPAFACLASRIPYGETVTEDKLEAIYKVEKSLKEMGYTQMRARHHGEILRIELLPSEWKIEDFEKINKAGREAGFRFTALDMQGYRMGNMNVFIKE